MQKLRGFTRSFWVANTLELFERLAYYGSKAVLAVYIAEKVGLGSALAQSLVGSFTFALYFMPVFAGAFVDRFGFKRSLMACFATFSLGYFLIGFAGVPAGKPIVDALGPTTYIILALLVTALGGSLIKPCIVGTVARTTTDETKGLGYSIYYSLVNLGGALGPIFALPIRENRGMAFVLMGSAAVSFVLFLGAFLFYKEPEWPAGSERRTLAKVLGDMFMVFGNGKFMLFLIIFSGFWLMFWQVFLSLPFYVKAVLNFERFELIETVDAWTIILVTIPAAALAKKLRPMVAMTLGFAIASVSWFLIVLAPPGIAKTLSMPLVWVINGVLWVLASLGLPVGPIEVTAVLAPAIFGLMLFAIGEATQAPRFYEYVANLAPKEQVGTYMGFAFVPVAIGALFSGVIGGRLVAHYIEGPGKDTPGHMWFWVGGIGIVSTIAMIAYDRLIVRRKAA